MKPKLIKELTIDRERWYRRSQVTDGASFLLLANSGKMCCLGFAMIACGFTADQIKGVGTPKDLALDRPEAEPIPLFTDMASYAEYAGRDRQISTFMTIEAMEINDNSDLSDEEKERRLIELFGKNGIKLTFVP